MMSTNLICIVRESVKRKADIAKQFHFPTYVLLILLTALTVLTMSPFALLTITHMRVVCCCPQITFLQATTPILQSIAPLKNSVTGQFGTCKEKLTGHH